MTDKLNRLPQRRAHLASTLGDIMQQGRNAHSLPHKGAKEMVRKDHLSSLRQDVDEVLRPAAQLATRSPVRKSSYRTPEVWPS